MALCHIKQQCSVNGKFEHTLLDNYQRVSYELAFCAAELKAAAVLLNYARKVQGQDDLLPQLVPVYCAEMLQSVWQRLVANADDMGLQRGLVMELMSTEPMASFLEHYLRAGVIAAVGAEILARGQFRLPSGLDEEKEMVRSSFARFTEQVVMPVAESIHRQDLDIPGSLIAAAAEMGCFGTCIPQRFGGLMPDDRSDSLGMIVVTEELSRGSLGAAGSLITRPEIAARALLSGGTAEQQQHWLPRLASAEVLAAIAITEPNYGSDVASVSLKARPVSGGWVLNGTKMWCTFAGRANVLVTLARSNPDPELGHRGLSLFLVEKPAFAGHQFDYEQAGGGRLTGKAISTIGYRGMHSFELFFDNYFVPAQGLLGGEEGAGRGFYHILAGFAGGRIQTAARATGLMQQD